MANSLIMLTTLSVLLCFGVNHALLKFIVYILASVSSTVDILHYPPFYPIFTSDLRHDLLFGFVLTCRCVRIIIQAGTGLFCLIFFNNLIFLVVLLRAAIISSLTILPIFKC